MTAPITSISPEGIERIEDVEAFLARCGYVADREIATALFLAIRLRRPLLVEGYAGVGKTEIAKTLAAALGTTLYRLQCYEGLDASAAPLRVELREANPPHPHGGALVAERAREGGAIFSEPYLLARPLLQALRNGNRSAVLLIDEIDRADEEFEAFLLEMLSEYQVTIPELGAIRAEHPPYVVLTSNRVRELGDALKRRCLYLWIGYPPFEKEVRIIQNRVPGIEQSLARADPLFVEALRELDLDKRPGVAESIDWGMALLELHSDHLVVETAGATLGCLVKSKRDMERVQRGLPALMSRALAG